MAHPFTETLGVEVQVSGMFSRFKTAIRTCAMRYRLDEVAAEVKEAHELEMLSDTEFRMLHVDIVVRKIELQVEKMHGFMLRLKSSTARYELDNVFEEIKESLESDRIVKFQYDELRLEYVGKKVELQDKRKRELIAGIVSARSIAEVDEILARAKRQLELDRIVEYQYKIIEAQANFVKSILSA